MTTATVCPFQEVRDRRLTERTDADRRHRDPDLASGDVVADVLDLGVRQPRSARPGFGHRLEPRGPRTDERVLSHHEERVHEDEQPRGDEEQRAHSGRITAPPWAPLLRDGSSSGMQRRVER